MTLLDAVRNNSRQNFPAFLFWEEGVPGFATENLVVLGGSDLVSELGHRLDYRTKSKPSDDSIYKLFSHAQALYLSTNPLEGYDNETLDKHLVLLKVDEFEKAIPLRNPWQFKGQGRGSSVSHIMDRPWSVSRIDLEYVQSIDPRQELHAERVYREGTDQYIRLVGKDLVAVLRVHSIGSNTTKRASERRFSLYE